MRRDSAYIPISLVVHISARSACINGSGPALTIACWSGGLTVGSNRQAYASTRRAAHTYKNPGVYTAEYVEQVSLVQSETLPALRDRERPRNRMGSEQIGTLRRHFPVLESRALPASAAHIPPLSPVCGLAAFRKPANGPVRTFLDHHLHSHNCCLKSGDIIDFSDFLACSTLVLLTLCA